VILYSLIVAGGLVADAWLLALVLVRGRRRWLQAAYAALALAFLVNGAAYVGTTEGFLSDAWQNALLASMVLAHPLTALLVLGLLHGETLPRRRPAVLLLLLAVPVFLLFTPSSDWAVPRAYDLSPLGVFLVASLALALAESIYTRMTSALLAADAFWLSVGVVALLIGGPVYAVELENLVGVTASGSNVGAPVALAAFALVAFHADPYPLAGQARRGRWSGTSELARGQAYVFDETRPTYALRSARRAASGGRPTLLLGRSLPPVGPDGPCVAEIAASRHAALRSLATASEFLARRPGGLVVFLGLADVSVLCGWEKAREAIVRLAQVGRETESTLLVATSRLTRSEKERLRTLGLSWWSLPDPAEEFEALLLPSFGTGARRLLESFCRSAGIRRDDLSPDHVPALTDFLGRAAADLGGAVADPRASAGLRNEVEAASARLRAFADRSPADLAAGDWPSRASAATAADLLVKAADYWKGKEMEELFAAARALAESEPLYERARMAFLEQLGSAGEGMFRSEVAKLGRRPEDLRAEDLVRLADRAAVDLEAMADIVDVPGERTRLQERVEALRRRLLAMAGDDA